MEPEVKLVPPLRVISRRDRVTIPRIPAHSGPAIQSLVDALDRVGVSPSTGDIVYIYHDFNGDPAVRFDLEICLPVAPDLDVRPDAPIGLRTTTPFSCLAVDYVGSMSGIGAAWASLVESVGRAGRQPTGEAREIYKKWVAFDSPENVTELQQGIE